MCNFNYVFVPEFNSFYFFIFFLNIIFSPFFNYTTLYLEIIIHLTRFFTHKIIPFHFNQKISCYYDYFVVVVIYSYLSFIHSYNLLYTTIVYTILDKTQITEQTSHSNLLLDAISIKFCILRALLKFLRMRNWISLKYNFKQIHTTNEMNYSCLVGSRGRKIFIINKGNTQENIYRKKKKENSTKLIIKDLRSVTEKLYMQLLFSFFFLFRRLFCYTLFLSRYFLCYLYFGIYRKVYIVREKKNIYKKNVYVFWKKHVLFSFKVNQGWFILFYVNNSFLWVVEVIFQTIIWVLVTLRESFSSHFQFNLFLE